MYYIYGSVRAILTYRVYRLYDIVTSPTSLCSCARLTSVSIYVDEGHPSCKRVGYMLFPSFMNSTGVLPTRGVDPSLLMLL